MFDKKCLQVNFLYRMKGNAMTPENQNIEIDLASELQEPQSSTVDGTNINNRSIADLIKADEHIQNKGNPADAIRTFRVSGNSMR